MIVTHISKSFLQAYLWYFAHIWLSVSQPDLSAPGVNILAAYSPLSTPSYSIDDPRRVHYTFLSGTSMACPHVSGAAAYVKTFHPDWSPSAIKSALMTTGNLSILTKLSIIALTSFKLIFLKC